jgi:hypothetical protein
MTTLGGSLFLLAVGAVLAFAVTAEAEGFDINTIGVILMIVGALGLFFSSLLLASWAPFGGGDRTVVRDREVVERDRV